MKKWQMSHRRVAIALGILISAAFVATETYSQFKLPPPPRIKVPTPKLPKTPFPSTPLPSTPFPSTPSPQAPAPEVTPLPEAQPWQPDPPAVGAAISMPYSLREVEPSGPDQDTVNWIIIDHYDTVRSVNYRFLSQERQYAWPSLRSTYSTPEFRVPRDHRLRCNRTGEKICVGGAVGRRYWGVGLDNRHQCTNCCVRCDGGTYEFNFYGR